jgi:hypothetical protein
MVAPVTGILAIVISVQPSALAVSVCPASLLNAPAARASQQSRHSACTANCGLLRTLTHKRRAGQQNWSPLCDSAPERYNRAMSVYEDKAEDLERYEFMMGVPRGRLAVTMDLVTDAMALVGQHGVYCQSQRWPGKPVMDIQLILKNLTDAKELVQNVMEELKNSKEKTA